MIRKILGLMILTVLLALAVAPAIAQVTAGPPVEQGVVPLPGHGGDHN